MTRSPRIRFPFGVVVRVAARDGYRCHVCEQGFLREEPWEVDHDRPLSKGGTNHLHNLRLAHRSCNREKSNA